MAKYRPPMWSSKLYGEPHGLWESNASIAAPAVGGKPGVHVTNARLDQLAEALRAVVKSRLTHNLHQTPRVYLLSVLRVGDTGSEAGQKPTGKISKQSFQNLLERRLRFTLTDVETKALFKSYGHDSQGNMPYDMFCRRLFAGKFKMMAMDGYQKGAYSADRPKDWKFAGMIKYPFLKKSVAPPSDWDPSLAARSARPPSLAMELEHVFGYSGLSNVSPNLFYTDAGDVVYYTAAVGIVYNDDENEQMFFNHHDDDITCLGISPHDRDTVATGQAGASPRVFIWSAATQQGPEGTAEPTMLQLPYGERSVCCLCFSQDGKKLVTVSTDNAHTVTLWDWRAPEGKQVLATAKGYNGDPPQIFGVVWNPFRNQKGASEFDFVTFGVKHINFWNYDPMQRALTSKGCTFGDCEQQDIFHACFLPLEPAVLTGGPDGKLCAWEENKASFEKTAHVKDLRAMKLREGGSQLLTAGGDGTVRQWDMSYPLAGPDGIEQSEDGEWPLAPDDPAGPSTVIALDCMPNSDTFIAGDDRNDIWEVDEDPQVMVEGQSGDVTGLAPHPLRPNLYATACADGSIYVWDSYLKKNLRDWEITRQRDGNGRPGSGKGFYKGEVLVPRVCCFSKQGDLLAVGTGGEHGGVVNSPDHPDRGGVLQVFEVEPKMFESKSLDAADEEWSPRMIFEVHHAQEGIEAVRFSPNGRLLAVANRDNFIDIYDVADQFRRVGRCHGHSSAVLQLDWSADGKVLMSNSLDHEALMWDIRGRPAVDQSQRDTEWDTWTCQLGFPVMGIWSDNMDGTDINAVDRSSRGGHVVVADDNGQVRMLNFPCVIDKAPSHAFPGHSSHVPNVRWLADDRRVVSAGGHDRTLFQWRIVGDDDTPADYGAAGKGMGAQMAAAREANAKKGKQDADEARRHMAMHRREVEVVGASKDLRVELR